MHSTLGNVKGGRNKFELGNCMHGWQRDRRFASYIWGICYMYVDCVANVLERWRGLENGPFMVEICSLKVTVESIRYGPYLYILPKNNSHRSKLPNQNLNYDRERRINTLRALRVHIRELTSFCFVRPRAQKCTFCACIFFLSLSCPEANTYGGD